MEAREEEEMEETMEQEQHSWSVQTSPATPTPGEQPWVVGMKERLLLYSRRLGSYSRGPCIFRIPEWIKDTTNKEAYRPWLVSLGPYHHDDPRLKPMEDHKRRAVLAVAERFSNNQEDGLSQLASAINDMSDLLSHAFDGLDAKWVTNIDAFKEMMLVDGCFLLEIIRVFTLLTKGEISDSYPKDDPVFSRHGFLSLYLVLKSDVIVMENQLPLFLLHKLHETIHSEKLEEKFINKMVLDFLGLTYNGNNENLGLHPLDILHRSFCAEQVENKVWGEWQGTMPSVMELAEAGIHFKKCSTKSVHAINFKNGVLTMPEIEVNDRTEKEFFNLMAFERLYGAAGNDATSFLIFMDNIIDSQRDVALLRSKGVIKNMLSSDEEAAKLFNTLGKGSLLSPSNHLYNVRQEVSEYCKKNWNKWRANFKQTYLRNPWVFSALVASVFLLIATFLQTIYTVMSFYSS